MQDVLDMDIRTGYPIYSALASMALIVYMEIPLIIYLSYSIVK